MQNSESIEILDDRLEITKRDWRVITTASQLTLFFLWALGSYILLAIGTGISVMCFWMWTMLMVVGDLKWYAILRRTYVVPLPTHHYTENGEQRKHEIAVHGTTLPA
jgi:hypothetical protein